MFNHPFLTTTAEYEEYVAACEAFADAADQLPDPPAEILSVKSLSMTLTSMAIGKMSMRAARIATSIPIGKTSQNTAWTGAVETSNSSFPTPRIVISC